MKLICKFILCCVAFCVTLTTSFAQKLPDSQKGGMRAPADLKIDGQLTEWGGMAAYNKRLVLYYTIANDDENLYLAIKSDNVVITHKILHGGFSFTINTTEKKEKTGVALSYPFIDNDEVHNAVNGLLPKVSALPAGMSAAQQEEAKEQRETASIAANRKKLNLFKFIKIVGIKRINDKLIPVYNELGIKVATKVDNKGIYTYELALPLKFLGIEARAKSPVYYNIKLLRKYAKGGMTPPPLATRDGRPPLGPGGVDVRILAADTDFWGEYALK
nr:hypothetical protein [uncultured Mucilaginibacter sp.]